MGRSIIPTLEAPPMMLSSLMSDWLIHLAQVEGYSPNTIENYGRTRLQFLAFLRATGRRDELGSFTDVACDEFMRDLGARGVGVNTIVHKLATLSSFATYGMQARNKRTGRSWFATNPTKAFKWPRMRRANIALVAPGEINDFLAVPLNGGKAMIRDLLFDTGLRASEIANANAEDLLRIGDVWFLEVTVKSRGGQRRRQFPISADVGDQLARYLRGRAPLKPGAPLIVRKDGQRYSRSHLGRVIDLIGKQAGITRFRMSPHKIRHHVALWSRMGGADPITRSALLGHSSPASIQSYEHVLNHELHVARAQQREGLRRYLSRADAGIYATPENRPGFPQVEGAESPVNMRSGGDSAPQRILWNVAAPPPEVSPTWVGPRYPSESAGRANQSHNLADAAWDTPDVHFCLCQCPAFDHEIRVSLDGRLVGSCVCACESFTPAVAGACG